MSNSDSHDSSSIANLRSIGQHNFHKANNKRRRQENIVNAVYAA